MTTKLIQELVGLVSEQNKSSRTKTVNLAMGGGGRGEWISFSIFDLSVMDSAIDGFGIRMESENAPAQLQAAIDKVKEL